MESAGSGAPGGFDIDVGAATEALEAAGGLEGAVEAETGQIYGPPQTPQGSPPDEGTTERTYTRDASGRFVPQPEPEAPAVPATAEDTESFMGEKFDPNSLPDELVPAYKQMQAHFTRRTQEAAPWAQASETLGIQDPAVLAQVVEHYNQLVDPNNYQALFEELAGELGVEFPSDEGFPPAEPQGIPANAGLDLSSLDDYPELAPLKAALEAQQGSVEALQSRLDDFDARQEQEAEQRELEQFNMAIMGEVQRQTQAVRQANPNYTDDDMDFVLKMSSFYDGGVVDAQRDVEQYVQARIQRYAESKQGVHPGATPLPGGSTQTQQPQEYETLDEGHEAAKEYLRQVEAQAQ